MYRIVCMRSIVLSFVSKKREKKEERIQNMREEMVKEEANK